MQETMFNLWSSFSLEQLEVIESFLSRSADASVAWVEKLRTGLAPSAPAPPVAQTRIARSKKRSRS